jgi:hypothetical protein
VNQRGRKSTSPLTLVSSGGAMTVERIERPKPPLGMPDAQAAVWRQTVESLEAEWFRPETLPLLAQYCRHVVASNVIAARIDELLAQEPDEETPKALYYQNVALAELYRMQALETTKIMALATKMRLAQQSTYDKSKKKQTIGKRPWQLESE